MEKLRGESAASTPAVMAARVAADAKRAFGERADATFLDQCARAAVADLWRDSIKVTSFIPVLALRHVREMLDARPDRAAPAPAREGEAAAPGAERPAPESGEAMGVGQDRGDATPPENGLTLDDDALIDQDRLTPD